MSIEDLRGSYDIVVSFGFANSQCEQALRYSREQIIIQSIVQCVELSHISEGVMPTFIGKN